MADDISLISRHWMEIETEIRNGLPGCVSVATRYGWNHARSVHRWESRTGATVASIEMALTGNTGIIHAGENATRLNDGTPAHDIWPKEGGGFIGPLPQGQSRRGRGDVGTHRRALRFEVGGNTVFARMVHHPGTTADPFLDEAADETERVLDMEVDKLLDRVLGK